MQTTPFNLEDFDFTFRSDTVTAVGLLNEPGPLDVALGIFNNGFVNTLTGNDTVEAFLEGTAGLDQTAIAFLNDGFLFTSFGDDMVSGSMQLTQNVSGSTIGEFVGLVGLGRGLISTGFGDDVVSGNVTLVDVGGSNNLSGFGLTGLTIFLGFGDDEVFGSVDFTAADGSTLNGRGINAATIYAGPGNDVIEGSYAAGGEGVSLTVAADGISGLRASTVKGGFGDDEVKGNIIVSGDLTGEGGNPVEINGIRSSEIFLGRGFDRVLASAEVVGEDAGGSNDAGEVDAIRSSEFRGTEIIAGEARANHVETASVIGIRSSTIFAPALSPVQVSGLAEVSIKSSDPLNPVSATGILFTTFQLDAGDDAINADALAVGLTENANVVANGMFNNTIKSRGGDDEIVSTAVTQGGGTGSAIGIRDSQIQTGSALPPKTPVVGASDNDTVLGIAEAISDGIATAIGIGGSSITTGFGNDTVIGKAEAISEGAIAIATATGIDLDDDQKGIIKTGRGNDIVRGEAEAGSELPDGFLSAAGIVGVLDDTNNDTSIFAGRGHDTITGIAAISAGVDDGAFLSAVGILAARINAGQGDDTIMARGQTADVEDVILEGSKGNDTFDMTTGTADIDGGKDFDTLILDGKREDFDIVQTGPSSFRVTNSAINSETTDFDVRRVELVTFSDGDVAFADLFVV
ncbi:MAG: hypothetical protein ROR55_20825 [Devosia sp.]